MVKRGKKKQPVKAVEVEAAAESEESSSGSEAEQPQPAGTAASPPLLDEIDDEHIFAAIASQSTPDPTSLQAIKAYIDTNYRYKSGGDAEDCEMEEDEVNSAVVDKIKLMLRENKIKRVNRLTKKDITHKIRKMSVVGCFARVG